MASWSLICHFYRRIIAGEGPHSSQGVTWENLVISGHPKVEKSPEDFVLEGAGSDTAISWLKKSRMWFEVPPADIMRMQIETLRPDIIIRTAEAIRNLGPGAVSSSSFRVYKGERARWAQLKRNVR
jgi:hypothetical protein